MYLALPWILFTAVCGLAHAIFRMDAFGRVLWKIGLCFMVLVQISISVSFAHTISDSLRLWKPMSTRWPEATSPVAAYLDVLYKRDPELISADFFDNIGFSWDATNTRERIAN